MNLRELQYLVALADHQHFSKAAESTFVSQPTLSMQIKKLEDELGVQLLERTNKRVLITPIGQLIADRARTILSDINELRLLAKMAKDPYAGEVKIGIIPTLAPYLLPNIIPALNKAYPDLTIYLLEAQTAILLAKLKQGEIDAAIMALPVEANDLVVTELFAEDFYLAVPQSHPLAKQEQVKINDLSAQNVLLLEEGHCLRGQALAVCQTAKSPQVNGFNATSMETLRQMVAAGIGVTLMPELACQRQDKLVKYLPFKAPIPQRQLGMLWRGTTARQALFLAIAKQIKDGQIRKNHGQKS